MKILLLVISFLIPQFLLATTFDGYIIKLKKDRVQNFFSTFENKELFKDMNISFGKYYHVKQLDKGQISFIENNQNVEYIEPNYGYDLNYINEGEVSEKTNDQLFEKQWGLQNTGSNSRAGNFGRGIKGKDINIIEAWKITKGNPEIIVGIMDSGVDYTHPDIKGSMWANEAEINGIEGVDDDGNGYVDDFNGYNFPGGKKYKGDPMDKNGHGTHTSGTVASKHDDYGMAGVAPNVKLMALKFKNDEDFKYYAKDALKAMDYAINNGAKVITCSIGGEAYSKTYLEGLNKLHEKGILFIQAAGNSNSNLDRKKVYPPSYDTPNMIVVGAHSGNGKKASFSNYGKKIVDIFAPG